MAAKIDENTQFSGVNGLPLTNGKIYIGSATLDPKLNPITIYSDRALSVVLANPQTLDGQGRPTNKIWIPQRYSLRVDDEDAVQQLIDLDAGEFAESGITGISNVQGTNAITGQASPGITAYADKEIYLLKAANANTGAVTLDIDGVGAKPLIFPGGDSLGAGDIAQNDMLIVVYNLGSDRFELGNARNSIPSGTITMFSGLIAAIPGGWAFCDGTNGTPDLRNLFVRCSNTDSGVLDNPGDTGGDDDPVAHTLTESEMPSHSHVVNPADTNQTGAAAAVKGIQTSGGGSTQSTGGDGSHTHGVAGDNIPAYHSLVYIMKL